MQYRQRLAFVILGFFQLFVSGLLHSQSPRFILRSDKQVVAKGETFLVEAVMENMDGDDVSFPDVAPFKVVQGPMNSSQFSLINGKRATQKSLQYVLLAVQDGRFTLPPATCKLGSKVLKSNALAITVTKDAGEPKQGQPLKGQEKETFVTLEISSREGWVGQQFLLDIVLYTRQEVTSYNLLTSPKHDAFFMQPITDFRDQFREVNLKGKTYYAHILKRDRLFARKAGDFVIDPVEVSLDMLSDGQNSFFFQDVDTKVFSTDEVRIKIKPLPEPVPQGFGGAVGEFTMDAQLQNPSDSPSEVCRLVLTIEGDGDAKAWQMPKLNVPEVVEAYEPKLIRDEDLASEGISFHRREVEYMFTSKRDTSIILTPDFTYFSPQKASYKTIKSGPLQVKLKGSTNKIAPFSQEKVTSPAWRKSKKLLHHDASFYGSFLFYLILVMIPALFLAAWMFATMRHKWKERKGQLSDNAEKATLPSLLSQAEKQVKIGDYQGFYASLLSFYTLYAKDKFHFEFTDDREVDAQHLKNAGASEQEIQLLMQIAQACQLARYAGVVGNYAIHLDDANQLFALYKSKRAQPL